MSSPAMSKVPNAVANLPLRFGRNVLEKRNIGPAVNLPLRFGRAFAGSLVRHPFSSRLERAPFVPRASHSLANLPQRFGRSPLFSLPQEIEESDQGIKK